jgi:hypothetical protein
MGSQGDMPRPFLYSTMHQAIESVQMTHSRLETCQKVRKFFFNASSCASCSQSRQDQRMAGHLMLADHTCAVASYQWEKINSSTIQMITPPCPAGSRAWSRSFMNVGCGPKRGCQFSALGLSAPLATQTAAVGEPSFFNPTSQANVHSWKSLSSPGATCVIFTPSTTASSISSSSTGAQRRLNTAWHPEQKQLRKWRKLSRSALTVEYSKGY